MVSGKYPSAYKDTIILPLFKTGDKKLCSNYRPIALTLTISKIFEKCIKKRLINFLNKHSFFSPNQYGFRPNMSTMDPLIETSHIIHDNLDKKFKVLGIFLDFKKTFDSVNHELLIIKLDFCGIRGNALNLIKSSISNRSQQVRIEETLSDINTNSFLVPQGTVLDPILFIICINGLLNLNLNANILCYADNTVVLVKNKYYNKLIKEANLCLDLIKNWCDNNNLQLNLSKSKYVIFNISNCTITSYSSISELGIHSYNFKYLNLLYNCVPFERVYNIKNLGILFDHKLKIVDHIYSVNNSIRKLFYKFKNTTKYLRS
jgi:hypothetical protein